uniref:Cytospin-A n=2 Tax=Mesocestoides corti TaxID=53468 RepID=A0A5K3FC40_MESCO
MPDSTVVEKCGGSIERKLDELLGETCKARPDRKHYTSMSRLKSPEEMRFHVFSHGQYPTRLTDSDRIMIDNQIATLTKENAKLCDELQAMRRNETDLDEGVREVRGFLLRAEEDKKRLAQRIEKLVANERVLVMEIERLKRRGPNGTGRPPIQKKTSQLDEHILGLEQDRDYWKGQVELLSQMLACPGVVGQKHVLKHTSRSLSARLNRPGTNKARRDDRKDKIADDTRDLPETQTDSKQQSGLQRNRSSTGQSSLPRSRSLPRDELCGDALENQRLRLERDELQMTLNRFETRIQEIQGSVQILTKERDDLQKLYSDAKNEIHRLHHDLYDVQNSASRRDVNQEAVSRYQAELERAQHEIQRLTAERDCLANKYKKVTEMESVDKQRHNKQMDYMEKALCEATSERDEVMGRISQLKRRLEELQCNQVQIEKRLTEKNEKLKKCSEETNNLRLELDARQKDLGETETKLMASRQRNTELEAACSRTEAMANDTSRRLQLGREEIAHLQDQLVETSNERDKLQLELDDLVRTTTQLQKNNKYLEKKYVATVSERDEVNTNCNRLAAEVKDLEQKLRAYEADASSWKSKFQLERSANEGLAERCSIAERRAEEVEFRAQGLANELRESQDARFQLERQVKSLTDSEDRLKSNTDRLVEENAALRSNIDLASKDKVKLEACIEDLTAANRQLVRDRDEVAHRYSLARERIAELEADQRSLEAEVKRGAEALNNDRQALTELRKQQEATRQRCEELEGELMDALNKHRNVEERLHQTELRASQLERELRLEHDDYLQVRSRLEATEEQRDAQDANRKVILQRVSELEAQVTSQMKELKETRNALEEESRILARKEEQLMTSLASEQSLKSEIAAAQSSLRECRRATDLAEKENIRLREELSGMVRDIQRLEAVYRETMDERDDLKQRVEDYLGEISRHERLLGERVRERDLLGEQLRTANEDADIWRSRWEKAEASASAARLECDEKELELTRSVDALEARERELAQCKANLAKMEALNQTLSKQATEEGETARIARAEIDALSSEISRLRESLARAETARSAKEREVINNRLEVDEARSRLQELQAALQHANETIAAERESARAAHLLLQSSREKEHASSLEAQERTNEVILLRERAVMAEERVDAHQREAARLYERLAETEKEASRLSRSLSTERFERERMSADMRSGGGTYRQSGYSGGSGRRTTSQLRSPRRVEEC